MRMNILISLLDEQWNDVHIMSVVFDILFPTKDKEIRYFFYMRIHHRILIQNVSATRIKIITNHILRDTFHHNSSVLFTYGHTLVYIHVGSPRLHPACLH